MKKMLSVLAVVALVVPSAQVVAMQRMRSAGAAAKARMQQARESVERNAKKLSEWTGSLMADVGRAIKKQDFKKIPEIMKRHKKKAAGIIGTGVVLAAVYGLWKLMTPPDFGEISVYPGRGGSEKDKIAAAQKAAQEAAFKQMEQSPGGASSEMLQFVEEQRVAAAAARAAAQRAVQQSAAAQRRTATPRVAGAGAGVGVGSGFAAMIPGRATGSLDDLDESDDDE